MDIITPKLFLISRFIEYYWIFITYYGRSEILNFIYL